MHSNTETRKEKRAAWLDRIFGKQIHYQIKALANDASFRNYFRIHLDKHPKHTTMILMDVPPEKENCHAFVKIDIFLIKQKIPVPELFHTDLDAGFILLEDFGDTLLAHVLNTAADHYYRRGIDVLLKLQQSVCPKYLVSYDSHFIATEVERFHYWFCQILLKAPLKQKTRQSLQRLYDEFNKIAKQQPNCFVHRDYHSRNILVRADQSIAIIDFQDAIYGPIVYDLVSLLKDCYIRWPYEKVSTWCAYAFEQMSEQRTDLNNTSFDELMCWFDFIGMQRHIKVLGIFARLYLRDNKPQYLKDIPRVIHYIQDAMIRQQINKDLFDNLEEKFMTLALNANA